MYRSKQSIQGLTLIELLVAMALGLLIVLAATAALLIGQQGFRTVDAASQLRDNGRFATDMMRRVILQAGYLSPQFAVDRGHDFQLGITDIEPNLKGFNNAKYNQRLVIGEISTVPANQRGVNGSDMLTIRYQVGRTHTDGDSDRTMINCAGATETATPDKASERLTSVFHVSDNSSSGELALMCTWRDEASGNWSTEPLVDGVESLQILYGTYGVTPNAAPTVVASNDVTPSPDRYLRADQLAVAGDEAGTLANWERVRSVRIGMILRSAPGNAPSGDAQTFHAFGAEEFSSADDPGSSLTPTADGRLRQVMSFTVHIRNPQSTLQ